MLMGMKKSSGCLKQGVTKQETYRQVQELYAAFKRKNESVICQELLKNTQPGCKDTCNQCIVDAVNIIEEKLI